jgi:hypothetical protein
VLGPKILASTICINCHSCYVEQVTCFSRSCLVNQLSASLLQDCEVGVHLLLTPWVEKVPCSFFCLLHFNKWQLKTCMCMIGLGILWEAPLHREVRSLLSASWALGSVIATVGSGVAALLKAVRIDGTAFVTGRRVSSPASSVKHIPRRCALNASL